MMKKLYFVLIIGLLSLSACARPGPMLLDNIKYLPPQKGEAPAAAPTVVVGVSPLKDGRGKGASALGRRTIASADVTNDLVVQGAAADMATARLKEAFAARGIAVKDVPAWDLTAEGIKAEGVDLIIGGEIRSLWVESTSRLLNTTINADVQLRVVAADGSEKKILRTLNLGSRLERRNIAFSFSFVEDTLSEALSSAIDQIFADEELKKRLR